MGSKLIFPMMLVFFLLTACQEDGDANILSSEENITEVFIYESKNIENTMEDLVTVLNKTETQRFEGILKEAERNTEQVIEPVSSHYDIEFKREEDDIDEIDLKLGNKGEESLLFYGYDSSTEPVTYIVSPEQTTKLIEIIHH